MPAADVAGDRPAGAAGDRTGAGGGGRSTARRLAGDWLPVLPFVLFAGSLLVGSAVWLVRSSFGGPGGGWTTRAWQDVLGSSLNRRAIQNSIGLAAVVATACAVIGTPLAWLIGGMRRGREAAHAVLTVVSNFGGASLAIAMVTTLGSVGFLRLVVLDWFGADLPIDLFSFWGLVVTYLYFILPLYVLLLLPALGVLRPEHWDAVQTSSGSRWDYWRTVGGPILSPFVLSGWVLTFTWSIGQFSVPFALLGETPRTQLMTIRLGNFLFSATGGTNRFNRAAVVAVMLIVLSAVALLAYRLLAGRMLRRIGSA